MFECIIITAVAMMTRREYEVLDQPRLTTRGGNRKEFNDYGSGLSTLKEEIFGAKRYNSIAKFQ